MWRDFHVLAGAPGQIVFFPTSGKFYAVPEETAGKLRAYLAGAAQLPPEAEAMVKGEMLKGALGAPDSEQEEMSSLCLYSAHDCNLACAYCYNQRGRAVKPFEMMAPETSRAAIDRFFRVPEREYALAFYGGEPLLNLRLIEATVQYAEQLRVEKGIRISFSVTTNGTVMNRRILTLLGRSFASVTVSLDGIAAVNDLHRRFENLSSPSVHDRAVESIRLLKSETSLRVTVKGTLTSQGLPHYRESLAYLRSLGADAVSLDPAFGPEDASWTLTGDSLARYGELVGSEVGNLGCTDESAEPWHEQTFQIVAGLLTKRRLRRHCNAGRDLAVMADGSLYACHGLAGVPAFYMGLVDDRESAEYARVHAELACLDVGTVGECAACWARFLCGGSCYANAYFKTGTVHRPDPSHCAVFKKVAERTVAEFVATATQPLPAKAMVRRIKNLIEAVVPNPHV